MPTSPDAERQLNEFYSRYADRLRHGIARNVTAPAVVIEDACAFAWLQVISHADVELTRRGYCWLYKVALREAWRLAREERHPSPHDPGEMPHAPVLGQRGRVDVDRLGELQAALDAVESGGDQPTKRKIWVGARVAGLAITSTPPDDCGHRQRPARERPYGLPCGDCLSSRLLRKIGACDAVRSGTDGLSPVIAGVRGPGQRPRR
jgi:hypothetical protein